MSRKKRSTNYSQLLKICKTFKANDPEAPKIIRTKKGRKGNDILNLPIMQDSRGKRYIPFCSLPYHTGILLYNPQSCIKKTCRHYKPAYLEKPDYKNFIFP